MSTEKSLKHLKSKDEFPIANVLNYFEKHSGRDISSSGNWGQQKNRFPIRKELRENGTLSSQQSSKRGQYKPVDDFDEVVIRKQCAGVLNPPPSASDHNLLSVLKTDIMSTIHQN